MSELLGKQAESGLTNRTGGEKAGQASEVVNHRCPQKVRVTRIWPHRSCQMLKFYESHLKWKSG